MIYLFNEEIKPTIFPDGTSQVWKLSNSLIKQIKANKDFMIKWDFENEGELIHVCQLAALILKYNTSILDCFITLYCPYLPYGRQDKDTDNESTFALTVFCNMISTYFDKLITIDAHNPNARAFSHVYVFENIDPSVEINYALNSSMCDLICYPDKGASTRYQINFPHIILDKDRDQSTGEILGLKIHDTDSGEDIKNKSVLIIDDICDGGRTFIEAAKLLYKLRAKEVCLYVTHGIFSKGLKPLNEAGIKRIWTKDGCECDI